MKINGSVIIKAANKVNKLKNKSKILNYLLFTIVASNILQMNQKVIRNKTERTIYSKSRLAKPILLGANS